MSEAWLGETRECPDEECPGTAEPEGDGEVRYWACTTCGYEFAWEMVRQDDPSCQLGVPESVRRRGSVAAQPAAPEPVFFPTIGRRPE